MLAPKDVCAVGRDVRKFIGWRDGNRPGLAILKPAHRFVRFVDPGGKYDVSIWSDIGEADGGVGKHTIGPRHEIAQDKAVRGLQNSKAAVDHLFSKIREG